MSIAAAVREAEDAVLGDLGDLVLDDEEATADALQFARNSVRERKDGLVAALGLNCNIKYRKQPKINTTKSNKKQQKLSPKASIRSSPPGPGQIFHKKG